MADGAVDLGFTEEELKTLLANLDSLSDREVAAVMAQVEELERRRAQKAQQDDLIAFCQAMQPDYKVGRHHRILADQLMALEKGSKDRVCVNMPPRHGKSQLVSVYYPAWFLGRNPGKKVMMVSHTTDLAVDFGRKVRNIIASSDFKEIFPSVGLAVDSKSAGRWNTNFGGEYFACGVGSALAGRGADLLLIDDPHSEQDVLNGNFEVFEKAYEWFTYGARTRLMPGGRVAVVQCMTGDTPVLMADGYEKPLKDVVVGDEVASYSEGRLTRQKVLNHTSNGIDSVYTIKTTCGKTVEANERHPFLALTTTGELQWTRLKHLKPGDFLVSLKDVVASGELKQNPPSVRRANPKTHGIESTLMHRIMSWGTGENTRVKPVKSLGVTNLYPQKGCAKTTTIRLATILAMAVARLKRTAMLISSTAMVSALRTTMRSLRTRTASALSVKNPQAATTLVLTGTTNSALTTATMGDKYVPSSAMIATLQSDMQKLNEPLSPLPNTSDFTVSEITSITPSGREEVFDLQVAETENFIADGLVSHNTRWHQDDLTGRVVRDMVQNEGSDQYEVVELPALLEKQVLDENGDETGETEEVALWPEFFDVPALKRTKASMPLFQWNSQYQQNPTSEEASIVKREWWNTWGKERPPACEYIISSLDAAAEKHNRADFTALTTWGVFLNEDTGEPALILLNSVKVRLEFPELKAMCLEHWKEWEPDSFIVEKKSAGVAIYQELRRMGIPLQEYTPHRGSGDKLARLNSVSDIISTGMCWAPATRWAEELIEEVAAFPFGSHDDLVDSMVMALMRFRQGGFIRLPTDEPEDAFNKRRSAEYY